MSENTLYMEAPPSYEDALSLQSTSPPPDVQSPPTNVWEQCRAARAAQSSPLAETPSTHDGRL